MMSSPRQYTTVPDKSCQFSAVFNVSTVLNVYNADYYHVLFVWLFIHVGVIYHSDRAVPGTADVVHKLKKLVHVLLVQIIVCLFISFTLAFIIKLQLSSSLRCGRTI